MGLDADKSALLIIDMQEKLFAAIHGKEAVLKNVELLIHLAQTFRLPIIVTEQYPRGLGHTLPAIINFLGDAYRPIEKTTFNCLDNGAFNESIKHLSKDGKRNLIICGIETHICVYQTAQTLAQEGTWTTHIAADATGSRIEPNWRWGLELMRSEGCLIKPTETILYEILKRSGTPEFKAMLPYIK